MIDRQKRLFPDRAGMTLVEMLVATVATLILMGAIAQVFSVFGTAVTNSRSMIELDSRIRTVAWKLRSDLAGATARTLPPLEPAGGEGYFEIIEGPLTDASATAGTTALAADTDDALLFTTRSNDTAFLGKVVAANVESSTAEVAWFLRSTAGTINPATFTLYRRQLLVVGYAGFSPFSGSSNTTAFPGWNTFYDSYDLSVRREGSVLIPNSLADLTRRESRFMHNPSGIIDGSGFPYAFTTGAGLFFDASLSSARVGEDVVLTNVLSFDVRVFDPAGTIGVSGNDAQVPGDSSFTAVANGCYVDLGNSTASGHFAGYGSRNYRGQSGGLQGSLTTNRTWDTWSTHYETNGVDDDGVAGIDQGSNGFDDTINGSYPVNGRVDDADEFETSPPYPFPLRGIEVRIRCYEPSSRQARQVTVRHTFVPH